MFLHQETPCPACVQGGVYIKSDADCVFLRSQSAPNVNSWPTMASVHSQPKGFALVLQNPYLCGVASVRSSPNMDTRVTDTNKTVLNPGRLAIRL